MPPMHELKQMFLFVLCESTMTPNKIIYIVLMLLVMILESDGKLFHNLLNKINVYGVNEVEDNLTVFALKIDVEVYLMSLLYYHISRFFILWG